MVAEATVSGKKKEAVAACALEACRLLDKLGELRKANHGKINCPTVSTKCSKYAYSYSSVCARNGVLGAPFLCKGGVLLMGVG